MVHGDVVSVFIRNTGASAFVILTADGFPLITVVNVWKCENKKKKNGVSDQRYETALPAIRSHHG